MIERLLVELRGLSPVSRRRVVAALYSEEGMLQRMDDDILDLIMRPLGFDDRIALLCALHRRSTSRVTAVSMLAHRVLTSALVTAFVGKSLVRGIHDMADRVLFTLPNCFSDTKTLVFADWTPFCKRKPTTLATVYWSAVPPHARCDLDAASLCSFSKQAVDRRAFAVRLSAHIEDIHAEFAVKVDRRITAIYTTPVQIVLWNFFSDPLDWIDVPYMYMRMNRELQHERPRYRRFNDFDTDSASSDFVVEK